MIEKVATGIIELIHGFIFLLTLIFTIVHNLESLDLLGVADPANRSTRAHSKIFLLNRNHFDVFR